MYLIGLLLFASFLVWGVESLAHVSKILGIRSGTALIGNAFAQSLNIISRFGFLIQTYIMAIILDRSLFIEYRLIIVLLYLICALASSFIIEILFHKLILLYEYLLLRKDVNNSINKFNISFSNRSIGGHLNLLAFAGYIFLYSGAVAPLIIQMLFPSMAARSVALGTILNGASTILLITILDFKIALNTQNNVHKNLSEDVYRSKYYASFSLIILMLGFILIKN